MVRRVLWRGKKALRRGLGLQEPVATDKAMRRLRGEVRNLRRSVREQSARSEVQALLLAEIALGVRGTLPPDSPLAEAELRVFSQFGDDGILDHLLRHVGPVPERFVEFGVEDYREANSRLLLQRRNWSGLVLDPDPGNIARIRQDAISWRHELVAAEAFVEPDNIDRLLEENGFKGGIGLLSIDVDGMDYWVWEAITAVEPILVVLEYNSVFGPLAAVTVPYERGFDRRRAHSSCLYFGASLRALCTLAARKGYAFVGSNSAGVNAWFVKRDRLGRLRELSGHDGYVPSRIRESRGPDGELTFESGEERLRAIERLPVYDVDRDLRCSIRSLIEEGRM